MNSVLIDSMKAFSFYTFSDLLMTSIGYLMKFDSNLEKKLYAEMKSCTYHPAKKISYIIPKMYEPDFCFPVTILPSSRTRHRCVRILKYKHKIFIFT